MGRPNSPLAVAASRLLNLMLTRYTTLCTDGCNQWLLSD